MSYPPLSNYYGTSGQSSNVSDNDYSANGSSGTYTYPSSITGPPNAQPTSYSSSAYGYSAQPSYSNHAGIDQAGESYSARSAYDYQRSNNYNHHESSLNDAYSQNYYGRQNVGHTRQQGSNDGLSNLAYASGLDSRSATSHVSQNTQQYDSVASSAAQQNRIRSPVDNQTRYSTQPPSSATSHPMQQQASASSTSSQQLAVNAAAALAGAVSRRYPGQQQGKGSNTSTNVSSGSSGLTSSQHTTSPQASNVNGSYGQQPINTMNNLLREIPPQHASGTSRHTSSEAQSNMSQQRAPSKKNTTQPRKTANPVIQQHQSSSTASRNIQQTGSIANLISAAHENEPPASYTQPSETQHNAPTFIDPAAVFDPYHRERERKRKEAVDEARRKAEEEARAEEARKQREKEDEQATQLQTQQSQRNGRKQQGSTKSTPSPVKGQRSKSKAPSTSVVAPPAAPPPLAASDEENMAAELNAMMEKMKAFQNKDPSLFKKLWNDMRQPASNTTGASVQSPSPQIGPQSLPVTTGTPVPAATQPTPATQTPSQVHQSLDQSTAAHRKVAKLGPDGNKLHLNGYPVVVENNPDGLPDLGRYPAERRIRPNKYNKKEKPTNVSSDPLTKPDSRTPQTPKPNSTVEAASTRGSESAHVTYYQLDSTAQDTPAALAGALLTPSTSALSKEGSNSKTTTGTIWPLEKRNALTATALRALKANPENANVPLTEDDLHKMLENNPSYIKLCEMLEQRGLKFHRGYFARELLNSVPELKTPTPAPTPTPVPAANAASTANLKPAQQISDTPTGSRNLPPPPRNSVVRGFQPHGHPPPIPPPGFMVQYLDHNPPQFAPVPPQPAQYGILYPSHHSHPPPPSAYKTSNVKAVPFRSDPPPGSKEAAARKRDFSELIDLTDLGDDENYVIPDKHPRLEDPESDVELEDNPIKAFQKQVQQLFTPAHTKSSNAWQSQTRLPVQLISQSTGSQQINASAKKPEGSGENKSERVNLAKQLNKGEALKKQYYDPKTVARDILIASGRHPYERPLNVHLAGMLGKYIDLDSDVSTFEWNEIDPGGPAVPRVELIDIPATKPRFKIGDRVRSKRDKPRSSLIDKTRRPEKEKRQKIIAPSASDKPALNTADLASVQVQPAKLTKSSGLRHSLLATDEHATPATLDPTRPPQIQSDRSSPQPPASVSKEKPTMEEKVKKKAGRPPGSKNKYPTLGGLRNQASEATGVKINVPPRDPTPGRERYKCKWKKCSTVLHNLDTLRKHIGRLHCPSSEEISKGALTCWWKKCKYLKQDDNGDWITTKVFQHREDWLRHIEREHVTPIAMKYGDGPSTAHVDPLVIQFDRAAYCADEGNHEVTPVFNDHYNGNEYYPPDVLNLTEVAPPDTTTQAMTDRQRSEKAAYLAYLKAHNVSKDTKAASTAVIEAMRKRKEKIGPGVDRGGCTLINQEMREILVQNPGIRRIVSLNE